MNTTRIFTVFCLVFLFLFSCKENDVSKSSKVNKKNSDTLLIDKKKCFVTFKWEEKDIEKYKKTFSNEDDFYVVMDDVNFYTAEGLNCLEKNGIDKIEVDKDKYKVISFGNESFVKIDTLNFFNLIFYEKGKQVQSVKPIEISENCKNYFTENLPKKSNQTFSEDNYSPMGYHILSEVKYDWDNDKIEDKIIVYDSIPATIGEGIGKRPLIALKGKGNNQFEFWFRNDNAIPCRSCAGNADPDLELKIVNGNLQYRNISLFPPTIKDIKYTFDKNFDLYSIDINIEEGGTKEKSMFLSKSKIPKSNLKTINIKKVEGEVLDY